MIKRISIKNFKSLRDVTVDLEPISVLVGRGGTGKSNFLNAIAFLRDCLLSGDGQISPSVKNAPPVLCAVAPVPKQNSPQRRGPEIVFKITFCVPGLRGEFHYELRIDTHPDTPAAMAVGNELLQHDAHVLFSRDHNKWVRPPSVQPLPLPSPISLQHAAGIREVGLAYTYLTAGIGCYDFNGDVLQGAPQRRKGSRTPLGLSDDASNYFECFEGINRNLQDVTAQGEILASLRKLKPALRGLGISNKEQRIVVALERQSVDVVFQLTQESEGFRRFLAHLLALYQVPAKSVVIFEEPEKGMYPGALTALADQIKAFPKATGGQVLLTTHNPLLLDQFEPSQIRVVDMENLETRIGPVAEHQMAAVREQLATTGELLTVDPAEIAE